jgi:plasmid stabilization system protein ParE
LNFSGDRRTDFHPGIGGTLFASTTVTVDDWPANGPASEKQHKPHSQKGESLVQQDSNQLEGTIMPRGDKSKYTDKQKRQAEHIAEGYEDRGTPDKEAKRRAWATVNAETHGGKKSGSGRGKSENHAPSKKGGKKGGAASASRSATQRSASAKKAARTRARNKAHS